MCNFYLPKLVRDARRLKRLVLAYRQDITRVLRLYLGAILWRFLDYMCRILVLIVCSSLDNSSILNRYFHLVKLFTEPKWEVELPLSFGSYF